MKNIHVLKTDKPSRLYFWEDKLVFGRLATTPMNRNIYITNDEEIKEGDWYLFFMDETSDLLQCQDSSEADRCNGKIFSIGKASKKIILTTDQDLIKDGVQEIHDEFLEWFVKNPSCEEVFLTNDFEQVNQDNPILRGSTNVVHKYKIIIPKEEPKMIECYFIPSNNTSSATICGNCGKEKMLHTIGSGIKVSKSIIILKEEPKQSIKDRIMSDTSEETKQKARDYGNYLVNTKHETLNMNKNTHYVDFSNPNADKISSASTTTIKQETLEESAERLSELQEGTYTPQHKITYKHGFEDGAKWQQERMYSEEDMKKAFSSSSLTNMLDVYDSFEEFIEQFNKK